MDFIIHNCLYRRQGELHPNLIILEFCLEACIVLFLLRVNVRGRLEDILRQAQDEREEDEDSHGKINLMKNLMRRRCSEGLVSIHG